MSDTFDRLLARAERRHRDGPGTCPDPAVLAAYLDGTLAAAERVTVEVHAADCSRCALQLATIVRLEDEARELRSAPAAPLWRRLLWTVPVATAALAAIIYVAVPRRPPLSAPQEETRSMPARQPVPQAERMEAPTLEAPASPEALKDQARIQGGASGPPAAAQKQRTVPRRGPRDAGTAPGQEAAAPGAPAENQAAAVADHAAPPALQSPPSADETAARADGADTGLRKAESDARAKAASRVAPAAPGPVGGVTAREGTAIAAIAERVTTAAVLIVHAPDGRVRWRVIASRIERSADAGVTWSAEPSPAAADLTMGVAPSADVCWLASPAGQVLRRADTGAWADVSPAPRVPITHLDAPGPRAAAIVASDGTRLRTSDAGRTWVRVDPQ